MEDMTSPPAAMMCATCKRLLAWWRSATGPLEWRHGRRLLAADGHMPVPVAPDDTVITVCDFCSVNRPAWVYFTSAPTGSIERTIEAKGREERHRFARDWEQIVQPGQIAGTFDSRYDEGWAACDGCARFIEKRDINRLISHVKATVRTALGVRSQTRDSLAVQWKEFFATVQPGRMPTGQKTDRPDAADAQP